MSILKNLKNLATICIMALWIPCSLIAADSIFVQKCTVTKSSGVIQLWSKEKSSWINLEDIKQCSPGNTIQTQAQSGLIMIMEPAITGAIEEKTIISFDKLLINHSKKNIRMVIRLQKGTFSLKMEPLFNYTALLTLFTPSGSIDFNSADVVVSVTKDTTICELSAGTAKIRQNGSATKSVLRPGTKAIFAPNNPEIVVSSITEEQKASSPAKEMKVAILSIQSSSVVRENLDRVSDFIAEEMEKKTSTKVLYLEDIRAMLHSEGLESLLSCFSDSCISQIGSAIGVDAVIVGGLGQLGNNYLFTLKMIDVLRSNLLNRESVRISGDISKILDEIPSMVTKMVKQAPTKPSVFEATAVKQIRPKGDSAAPYRETVVWLKGGAFVMGTKSLEGEIDESPPHSVTLHSFFMDKYEVTKQEFERVTGYNPSSVKGCNECPVDNVTWLEAEQYCAKAGKRLPTEAEWEYACRAGTTTQFAFGNTMTSEQANFNGRFPFGGAPSGVSRDRVLPVGSYKSNAWGLFDMHGNVAEWCYDWYDAAYYGNSVEFDPQGPKDGKLKVVRGGSFTQKGSSQRSARRSGYNPIMKLNSIGFRCAQDDTVKVQTLPDTAK
jgi:formylglycine-generating enzyme required for sulfatase activity